MRVISKSALLVLAGLAAVPLLAAALPPPLTTGPALWEVGKSADGAGALRSCVADPGVLAQWEHRRSQCKRTVLTSTNDDAVIEYSCPDGGFGRSHVRLVTPRTLRIETQGISDSYPFAYVLHARKVGQCPGH